MFKFMKSKKGFSLVELMIVVVIMAILVAVAVPIFNSVTGSSRAKTCIDNQRSIISTLNNALLSKTVKSGNGGNEMTFYVVNLKEAKYKGFSSDDDSKAAIADGVLTAAEINGLFQTAPYCPADNSAIKVQILASDAGDGTAKVLVECRDGKGLDNDKHILGS